MGGRATTPPGHRTSEDAAVTRAADAAEILERAVVILNDMKAEDVVALDLRGLSSVADYFLIASGGSEQHVRALAKAVDKGLSAEGIKVWHREGEDGRRWILLDYVDVVIHLFHVETRQFYRLENLWGDAKRVSFSTRTSSSEAG